MGEQIWPVISPDTVAAVSTDEMRELDRLAIATGLSLEQMMENAGIRLADVALHLCKLRPGQRVAVMAGGGNNGGGALAAARHLSNRGIDITVVLDRIPSDLTEAGRRQLQILRQTPVSVSLDPPSVPEAIIDGLVGYGLLGNPQDRTSVLIEWANASRTNVLALDVPSGLDATTGMRGTPCLVASATLTLALPKTGLLAPGVGAVTGDLLLADISIPAGVYEALGVARPGAFRASSIVAIAG